MYLLLNKNKVIAKFDVESILGFDGVKVVDTDSSFNHPLLSDIQSFILNRKAPKHRQHIDRLLKICGCDTLAGYLDVSHALSLNDTLWVKRETSNLCWEEVSLYTHPFNTTIARIAFDGGMFGQQLSSTSPEFGTNGTFAKCWIRENNAIKLVKCGSDGFSNCGLEPYSEYYASQILSAFGVDHVEYGLTMRHGKLASKCTLFTSEDIGLIPFSAIGQRNNVLTRFVRKGGLKLAILPIILPLLTPLPGCDTGSAALPNTRDPTWETTVGKQASRSTAHGMMCYIKINVMHFSGCIRRGRKNYV